jgi:hypothetical protein
MKAVPWICLVIVGVISAYQSHALKKERELSQMWGMAATVWERNTMECMAALGVEPIVFR